MPTVERDLRRPRNARGHREGPGRSALRRTGKQAEPDRRGILAVGEQDENHARRRGHEEQGITGGHVEEGGADQLTPADHISGMDLIAHGSVF